MTGKSERQAGSLAQLKRQSLEFREMEVARICDKMLKRLENFLVVVVVAT